MHTISTEPSICKNNITSQSEDSCSTLNKLRHWAVTHKITHNALKDLLNVLSNFPTNSEDSLKSIPKDPRTFLKTPTCIQVRSVEPGKYYHIGIQKSLEQIFHCKSLLPDEVVEVSINIDGIPLTKSSSSQLYPILGSITLLKCSKVVFPIGIYHGYTKPNNFNEFMLDFVNEAISLTSNGLDFFGQKYKFKVKMFCMDAVAKASALYIKGHSGYYSCTKCTQEGEYKKDRICFPSLKFNKRTHNEFVNQTNIEYHTGYTSLVKIPNIDIIKEFPLDYMHLVALGVVKKIVCGTWCFGKPPHKLSSSSIETISKNLMSFIQYLPSEFVRSPRSLSEVKRWKATEFRQFLFYTGSLALKGVISKQKYQNFLTLSVAMRILSSSKLCHSFTDYAEELLIHFVKMVKNLYGPEFLSHNFHNLLHLVDDVRCFGSIEKF